MSIPNPFRPVCGTLGGVSIEVPTGYVSPDVFWLDARAQGDGLTTSMIDIVGMRRIALSTGGLYIADGVARGDIYIDEAPHARNSNYAVELVFACNPGANWRCTAQADKGTGSSIYPMFGTESWTSVQECGFVGVNNTNMMCVQSIFTTKKIITMCCQGNLIYVAGEIHQVNTYSGRKVAQYLSANGAIFCALRVHSRNLTTEEMIANDARDAERWDKTKIMY